MAENFEQLAEIAKQHSLTQVMGRKRKRKIGTPTEFSTRFEKPGLSIETFEFEDIMVSHGGTHRQCTSLSELESYLAEIDPITHP